MEGAPEFTPQLKGPFHKRKRADLQTVALNALLKMRVANGGKFVYGDNGCILDLAGNNAAGGATVQIIVNRAGTPYYLNVSGTFGDPV